MKRTFPPPRAASWRLAASVLPVLLTVTPLSAQAGAMVMRQMHSAATGDEITVTCEATPIARDYAAEAASGVPLTDPYAVQHDADKGLIELMNEGGRRVQRYVVPGRRIRAVVRLQLGIAEHVDLVFTPRRVILVHTDIANAGIFTISDVYWLPYHSRGGVDARPLQGDSDLLPLLPLGFSAYDRRSGRCLSGGGKLTTHHDGSLRLDSLAERLSSP